MKNAFIKEAELGLNSSLSTTQPHQPHLSQSDLYRILELENGVSDIHLGGVILKLPTQAVGRAVKEVIKSSQPVCDEEKWGRNKISIADQSYKAKVQIKKKKIKV